MLASTVIYINKSEILAIRLETDGKKSQEVEGTTMTGDDLAVEMVEMDEQ